MLVRRAAAVPLVVLSLACVERLPPVAAPAPGLPPATLAPTPPGQGILVVDVADGPTAVRRLDVESAAIDVGRDRRLARAAREAQPVCVSPCALTLPFGPHALAFPLLGSESRLEIDVVQVGPTPVVYRRTLGRWEPAGPLLPLGIVAAALGGGALVTGISLTSVGFGTDDEAMTLGGGITLGAGVVVSTLAILALTMSPARMQPGASVHTP